MIYSISLILKDRKFRMMEREFAKQNKVLNQKEIEMLIKNLNTNLPILESAVASHKPIGGVPYYTFTPGLYGPLAGHDDFRKATIAAGVGAHKDQISKEDLPYVYSALEALSPLNKGNARTKILAWDSLGKVGMIYPEVFNQEEERAREALNLSKDINASSYLDNSNNLGAVLFLEKFLNSSKQGRVERLLQDTMLNSDSIASKAMLTYLAKANGLKLEEIVPFSDLNPSLVDFYKEVKAINFFNAAEIDRGYQLCGVASKADFPLWEGTPHAKCITQTMSTVRGYPAALGRFSEKNYKEFIRRE